MSTISHPTTLKLRTGTEMPFIGLGTWKAEKGVVGRAVELSLKNGYRHIDCASDYGNEQEVGEGITRALTTHNIKREDIFITSKLWNTSHHKEHVRPACERTIRDLGVGYLDLYLIHFPISLKYVDPATRYPAGWTFNPDDKEPKMEFSNATIRETWEAMEDLVTAGLVKNIGVSNFSCALLMDLLKYARIPPAVNQLEIHPMLQQSTLVNFCQQHNIHITAFSPFGALSYYSISEDAKKFPDLLKDEKVIAIANKHHVAPGQVLLRFSIQRNIVCVPKSVDEARLKQNLDVFHFTLDASDMTTLASFERGARFNDPGVFAKYPIWN